MFHKNSRIVNGLALFKMMGFNIYDEKDIYYHTIADKKIAIVPWVLKDKTPQISSDVDLVLGHFEFKGAYMTSSYKTETGLDPDAVKGRLILSGHYHIRQRLKDSNIWYLGTMYQKDWGDFGLRKGFHILDLETMKLEFIEIASTRHIKIDVKKPLFDEDAGDIVIKIDDGIETPVEYSSFDEAVKGLINIYEEKGIYPSNMKIKLFIHNKVQMRAKLKAFIAKLDNLDLNSLKIELLTEEEIEDGEPDELMEKAKASVEEVLIEALEDDEDMKLMVDILEEAKSIQNLEEG
jgi:hypothetical protein